MLLYRWVLQQEGVTSVIVGARLGKESTRRHLAENARVFQFELDAADLAAIRAVQVLFFWWLHVGGSETQREGGKREERERREKEREGEMEGGGGGGSG